LEKYAGQSFSTFFNELIHGKSHWDGWLNQTLESVGVHLIREQKDEESHVLLKQEVDQDSPTKELFLNWINSL
jgi:hypothetical protein